MKRTFFVIALISMLFSSCESNAPALEITSGPSLAFDENGGELKITYQLTNVPENEDVEIVVAEEFDWFVATPVKRGEILVVVEKNGKMEDREGVVELKYGALLQSVAIYQYAASEDGALELDMLVGQFNGTKYSTVPNYYFCLTDNGFVGTDEPLANSIYYRIDLYVEGDQPDVNNIKIPEGTYTLDLQNSYANGTISQEYSFYLATNDSPTYDDALLFTEATLNVTSEKVQLTAVDQEGQLHNVVYKGDYVLSNKSGQGEGVLSDLTGDYEPQVSENFAICEFYGDFYGCGYGNWMILLRNPASGDEIQLDFLDQSNNFDAGFAGNYVCRESFDAMTLVPGRPEGSGYIGCWYFEQIGGSLSGMKAPFTAGSTMVAVDNQDGTYTLTVEAYDDTPERHKISFEWTGEVNPEDWSSMFGTPPSPASKFAEKAFRLVR